MSLFYNTLSIEIKTCMPIKKLLLCLSYSLQSCDEIIIGRMVVI